MGAAWHLLQHHGSSTIRNLRSKSYQLFALSNLQVTQKSSRYDSTYLLQIPNSLEEVRSHRKEAHPDERDVAQKVKQAHQ
jgi:hypothetical protein